MASSMLSTEEACHKRSVPVVVMIVVENLEKEKNNWQNDSIAGICFLVGMCLGVAGGVSSREKWDWNFHGITRDGCFSP